MSELDEQRMAYLQQSREVAQLLIEIGNLRLKNIELESSILAKQIQEKQKDDDIGPDK